MVLNLKNKLSKLPWILGVILFFVSFAIRFYIQLKTSYPSGWDGYYYIMQVQSWIEFGHLQSKDFSLIYPFYILISLFTNNYILGYKIGTAIVSGFLSVAIYGYMLSKTKSQEKSSFIAAITIFSPSITFLLLQFPKNTFGMAFFIVFLIFFHHKKILPAILFFLLAFVTHRMVAGFSLIFVASYFLKRKYFIWIVGASFVLVLLSQLPGIIHFSDFARFKNEFTLNMQFPIISFFKLNSSKISLVWKFELIIYFIAFCLLIIKQLYNLKQNKRIGNSELSLMVLILITIFPFFEFQNGSIGFRLFLTFPILILIASSDILIYSKNVVYYLLSVLLLLGSVFSINSYKAKYFDAPNELYEVVTEKISQAYSPNEYPLIIAHKSLAEVIIFKTDFDALNWAPPTDMDKNKIIRVVSNIERYQFNKYLSDNETNSIFQLTSNFTLIKETLWHKFMDEVKNNKDLRLLTQIKDGNNPIVSKPYYLQKGKE